MVAQIKIAGQILDEKTLARETYARLTPDEKVLIRRQDARARVLALLNRKTEFESLDAATDWMRQCMREAHGN